MREATDKQLKLIIEMELWFKAFNKEPLEDDFTHEDSEVSLQEASKWISNHMELFKSIKSEHSYKDLFNKL